MCLEVLNAQLNKDLAIEFWLVFILMLQQDIYTLTELAMCGYVVVIPVCY